MKNITVSIAGASGYTGMETLRYLSNHPFFELKSVYGDSSAGKSIDEIYPAFTGVFDQTIEPVESVKNDDADAIIMAMPHGLSASTVQKLLKNGYRGKIIDIGSDFRLENASDYQKWYNLDHPSPELLSSFLYALPEFNRSDVKNAEYVANPGCFATALQMALIPLVQNDLVKEVFATGLTGSSGSGAKASETTHFSSRFGNLKAYKVFKHQHLGEVLQNTSKFTKNVPDVHFTPVSAPIVRGIWITVSGSLHSTVDLQEVYEMAYYNAPLVRLRNAIPELKPVIGTAFTDIGWVQNGHAFTVGVAIDNMGKGAAGQMIQNLNLMFDLPEETGLLSPGIVL